MTGVGLRRSRVGNHTAQKFIGNEFCVGPVELKAEARGASVRHHFGSIPGVLLAISDQAKGSRHGDQHF